MNEKTFNERDFSLELDELMSERPEIALSGSLPEEVIAAGLAGESLKDAFRRYDEAKKSETEILRQNALSAGLAPVGGVSGGGTPIKEGDEFLLGLNEDY